MTRRFRVVGALLIGLALAIFAFAVGRPVKVLPRMAPAPPYDLVDPWGRTVVAPAEGSPITLYTFGALRDTEGMASIRHFIAEASRALNDAGPRRPSPICLCDHRPGPRHARRAAASADRCRLEPGFRGDDAHRFLGRHPPGRRYRLWSLLRSAPTGRRRSVRTARARLRYDPTVIIVDGDHVIRARYALEGLTPRRWCATSISW